MKTRLVLFISLIVAIAYYFYVNRSTYHETNLKIEKFGDIKIFQPVKISLVTTLFADSEFLNRADFKKLLDPLFKANSLIFVVNSEQYLESLEDNCSVIGGEIERFGQTMQNNLNIENFSKPLLLGVGQKGALISYVARFQSPDRFIGTLSYDLCPLTDLTKELCTTDSLKIDKINEKSFYKEESLTKELSQYFSKKLADQCIVPESNFTNLIKQDLPEAVGSFIHSLPIETDAKDPLIKLPAKGAHKIAIFLSGDGGWAGIDQHSGEYLQDHGVSVLGFNSLKYFWKLKTAEETTLTIEALIKKYGEVWNANEFLLVGYSLGANAVPVIYNRLPEDIKNKISKVVMIAPESKVDLEVHITDWVGLDDEEKGEPLINEVIKIPANKVLCLYGADDKEGVCAELDSKVYKVKSLPGGHHFDGDYETVGKEILAN